MEWLRNIIRRLQRRWLKRRFAKCLESEVAEEFLQLLLTLMRIGFKLDREFRRNLKGFEAVLQFRSIDNSVTMVARFADEEMVVQETLADDADSILVFKNGRALMDYLLSSDRDILQMLLRNEVVLTGNLNNVLKFGYMATHMQLALTGGLP